MLYSILFAVMGLAGGLIISAGVFALVTSTGLMTRLAQTTHTAGYVEAYETAVIMGAILCNVFWVFQLKLNIQGIASTVLIILIGLVQGIYVGCLAVSLAEALNATAIFARRSKLTGGFGFIILAVALGKIAGAVYQFMML